MQKKVYMFEPVYDIAAASEWLKDKIVKVMTREMIFEAGSDIANGIVPSGGLVVKIIDKMTK